MRCFPHALLRSALVLAQLLSCLAVTFPDASARAAAPDADPLPAGLHTLASDASGLVLELITPPAEVIPMVTADGAACQELNVTGWAVSGRPGWPELPLLGALLGLPPEGEPRLSLLDVEAELLPGVYRLCPAAELLSEQDDQGNVISGGERRVADPAAYAGADFAPADPAHIASVAWLRDQRVAQIKFQPFQYHPQSGQVRWLRRVRVRLEYGAPSAAPASDLPRVAAPPITPAGGFERLLQSHLANYAAARPWRRAFASSLQPERQRMAAAPQVGYKIEVATAGLVRLTGAELQSAGADLAHLDPHSLRVLHRGAPVAVYVTGAADGRFDPEDALFFYAAALETRYTTTNVYWLHWGEAPGLRMLETAAQPAAASQLSGYIATQRLERNLLRYSNLPSPTGDVWYWSLINAYASPAAAEFSLAVSALDRTASGPALLTVELQGKQAWPQHHTRLYLNGSLIHDVTWPALGTQTLQAEVPLDLLVEGDNTLRIESPRDNGITQDQTLVNWLALDYPRRFVAENGALDFTVPAGEGRITVSGFADGAIEVYDITDPAAPQRLVETAIQTGSDGFTVSFAAGAAAPRRYLALTPARYVVPAALTPYTPAGLHSPANGADYLVIAHPDFIPAIQPLVEWRESQGRRVQVVDVNSIYDEFNYGLFDAQAIHDFLAYAYHHWQPPAPEYVLLVGDGHFDPRNFLGANEPVYLPAYLDQVDPHLGETAADNRYVTVSGDDLLPDMLIGRLPARSAAEAAAMAHKIISYEQTPAADWNRKVVFVADNSEGPANDYPKYANKVINGFLPAGYMPETIYYRLTHTTVPSAQTAIRNALNTGSLMVNYVGHGAVQGWATENLFTNTSAAGLTNTGRLPFFVQMTCLTGYFINPSPAGQDHSALAEVLVRLPQAGAVASWSSSGMGYASAQDYLNRGLYDALFYRGATHLGAAALQAKLFLVANTTGYDYEVDIFNLLGDPATQLQVAPSDLRVAVHVEPQGAVVAGQPITYTLSYANVGPVMATAVRLEDELPLLVTAPVAQPQAVRLLASKAHSFQWELGNLAPGASGEIVLTGVVSPQAAGELVNQATVAALTADADPANNTSQPVVTPVFNPNQITVSAAHFHVGAPTLTLTWKTTDETYITGFNLYRSDTIDGDRRPLTAVSLGSQNFGQPVGAEYTFADPATEGGRYYFYWIEIVTPYGAAPLEAPLSAGHFQVHLPFLVR